MEGIEKFKQSRTILGDFKAYLGELIVIPLRANQALGAFPFRFNNSNNSLSFSWLSFPIFFMFLRVIFSCTHSLLFRFIQNDVNVLFAYLSKTERFVHVTVASISGSFDFFCFAVMIRKRKQVVSFFTSFTNKVVELIKLGFEELDEVQAKALGRRKMRLNVCMGIVFLLALFSYALSFIYFCVEAPESAKVWWKVLLVSVLSIHWIALNQLRLLTFYFCISIIICFRAAFMALYVIVDQKKANQSRRIFWVVEMYKEVEILLEEFQSVFEYQLLNISYTFVLPTINSTFQISKLLTGGEFGKSEWNGLGTLIPNVVSATLTFAILCDACTGMTDAAVKCVSSFRDASTVFELRDDKQDKLLMFYTSALAKPPRIYPGKFFFLGRQALPSILGLVTTYLIVLQQFKQQEDLTQPSNLF
ncbi:unnamed protein product [Orchesella dallaii]|uniref:Gustatory receptor n=1 Tax=Orchesella dallaii TaxID=48710 RepID=A0ABP1R2P0_9HEXA